MPKKRVLLPDKINWSLLHTFFVIVEKRSLSIAGATLNLTQSAISHSLKRLEDQVGTRLIERSNRQFNLTGQGQQLYDAVLSIYRELGRLDDTLACGENSLSDTLNILALSRLEIDTFDDFLLRFRQRYPKVKIQMQTLLCTDILNRLSQKISAIGLTLCGREKNNLNRVRIFTQRYTLYCGKHHPLFTKEIIRKQDLHDQNFVSWFSEQLGDVLSPLAVFREEEQLVGETVASINNIDELRRFLYLGFGIGYLPENVAWKDEMEGNLRRLSSDKGVTDVPIYLVWHKQRKLRLAELAFMEGLCMAFGQEASWKAALQNHKEEDALPELEG